MANFKDEDKINELRERLYSRGQQPKEKTPYVLTSKPKVEATGWSKPPQPKELVQPPQKRLSSAPIATTPVATTTPETMAKKPKKRYRLYVLLAGLIFFVASVIISSAFFLFGNNSISGDNIVIAINGPFTIGGGEIIPLQVAVTNQNAIPIESATLIVTYPPNTQSANEDGTMLMVERLPLDTLEPGQTLNIPLRAVIFGDEDQEQLIQAEVEYRVQGSNSTFARGAEPLRIKIGSSPVSVQVKDVQQISSGQETMITFTVRSNSPNDLRDILVRAEYPVGFEYLTSNPEPVSGQNVWQIDSLPSGEEVEISIEGIVVGQETDQYTVLYSVGIGTQNDPFDLASVFATAVTEFVIERPFIDVTLELNRQSGETVPVEAGDGISALITLRNTLDYVIYDAAIELAISGNALSDYVVDGNRGFYDSAANTIRWESSEIDDLRELSPSQSIELRANLEPNPNISQTPQLAFEVDARARRVVEGRVSEELIGTAAAVARVTSEASILSEAGRNTSIFSDRGPLPPVAEEETTYTITLLAENGTNDISDVNVTTSLPPYVSWAEQTAGAGSFSFNDTTRTVTWSAGDIDANQSKIASFQVTLLPSKSQIDTTPTLIGEQRLRATDQFTGEQIRATRQAVTTRLSPEAGYDESVGDVVDTEPN